MHKILVYILWYFILDFVFNLRYNTIAEADKMQTLNKPESSVNKSQ